MSTNNDKKMPEKETDVRIVSVDYLCDECHAGAMVSSGIALYSYPARYPHKCNNCGAVITLRERYPVMRCLPPGRIVNMHED